MVNSITNSNSVLYTQKRGSTWVWLGYTFFLFILPIIEPSTLLWTRTLVAFTLFFVVFTVYTRTQSEALRRGMILATYVIGLASFPWNSGASTFFVYTAAFLPFSFARVQAVLALMAVEIAGVCIETYLLHMAWPNTLIATLLLSIIGAGNFFFAQQRRADCLLRKAQEENVALAAVAERERIARDLHDVLGHTLSVIVLKAELAGRLMERNPARAANEIAEVERTARTALAEVREAIGGYRARGLLAEIESARRVLDAAGVTLLCEAMPEAAGRLHANEETVLALALREAVTNIVRHARATTCTLHFRVEGNQHRLIVEDNGHCAEIREGNGLRGMRERVEAIGGRVTLDRSEGTRLSIALPVLMENMLG